MVGRAVLIGVDGGGTKTTSVALDLLTLQVLGNYTGAGSNWNSIGADTALKSIQDCISGVLQVAGRVHADVAAACLGLSGVDQPSDEEAATAVVQQWLPDKARVIVRNDSVIALASGTGGKLLGCGLIIGTGTIALGIGPNGQQTRASGWGPLFKDGGSAYDIGQRGLAAVAREADGRGPGTLLTAALCKHCGAAAAQDLLGWAYAHVGWAHIAALAPAVVGCAEAGDPAAAAILAIAAREAIASVAIVAGRCGFGASGFPVVLSGGLLSDDNLFTRMLVTGIKAALPAAMIVQPSEEAAISAAKLAHHYLLASQEANGC